MRRRLLAPLVMAGLLLAVSPGVLLAGPIPYPTAGVQNPVEYSFTAATDGDVTAYFFAGAGAGFTNELTMLINGTATGIQGLNNHSSAYGDSLVLGSVSAGDVLVFKMVNLLPGGIGPWYSDKSLNSDGVNHVYSTDFGGDASIPAGAYVAFEDLPSDWPPDYNYNDLSFVFTNVATAAVPEPASLSLLGLGIVGVGVRRWRRRKA